MQSTNRLSIVVHTCKKFEESRCQAILQTWGTLTEALRDTVEIAFITDNPSSNLPNAIYKGEYPTGPTYHPQTFCKILRYFLGKKDFEFYMVVDDDTYLCVEKLLEFLRLFDSRIPYLIGDFLNWPLYRKSILGSLAKELLDEAYSGIDEYQLWPGGGPGLVFTFSSIEKILRLIQELESTGSALVNPVNHDLWLHKILKSSSSEILRVHCPGFHQYGNDEQAEISSHNEPISLLYDGNQLAVHRIISVHLNGKINQMSELHEHVKPQNKFLFKVASPHYGYELSNDWFYVAAIKDGDWPVFLSRDHPSKILEIGSYEGASAVHLIINNNWTDEMRIWCVDTWQGGQEHKVAGHDFNIIEQRFDRNIERALGYATKNANVVKLKGRSNDLLPRLISEGHASTFDYIYIDGSHQAPDVLCDAVFAFQLLKKGGLLIFDDYLWAESLENANNPLDYPRLGIDAFTSAYFAKIKIEKVKLYQLYVRKTCE